MYISWLYFDKQTHTHIYIYMEYGCVFFSRAQILVKARCSSWANHTPESYPESYPRIIPPKITTMNVSFGVVWDCSGLSSLNGPDKQIDQCWPDPVILGYLHIPSRHEL